jgi:glycosyltransferase involved in cell wall biosynthesis
MKILQVVHGYPPTDIGGAELCTQHLAKALCQLGHSVAVFCRLGISSQEEYWADDTSDETIPVRRVNNNFTNLVISDAFDYHPKIESLFEDFLTEFQPDLVHIQHLAGTSSNIPVIIKNKGLPMVYSLHDYWYMCERVQLLRLDQNICDGPKNGNACAFYCHHSSPYAVLCLAVGKIIFQLGSMTVPTFLRFVSKIYKPLCLTTSGFKQRDKYKSRLDRLWQWICRADAIVSPSEYVRQKYIHWGLEPNKIQVIPHGLPQLDKRLLGRYSNEYRGDRPLEVGYLGTIMYHKGVHILLKAVKNLSSRDINVHIYGRSYGHDYLNYLKKICYRLEKHQVFFHGEYRPSDLSSILSKLDVIVIPSLWHEAFNLVLREAWQGGLPVITAKVGGIAEVVKHGENGLLFQMGKASDLAKQIQSIINKPGLLKYLKKNIPSDFPTPLDHARQVEKVYLQIV